MKTSLKLNLLLLAAGLVVQPAGAACPDGSYASTDPAGVETCLSSELAEARKAVRPAPQECPAGTHPWVDPQGKPVCERLGNTVTAPDVVEECPKGSVVMLDPWGKKHCRML